MNANEFRTEVEQLINAHAAGAKKTELAAKLSQVCGQCDAEIQQNRRARYQDAGAWAVHFSNVRSGVTTFLIGLAIGIVSFEKSSPSEFLKNAALVVWGLAILLFVGFTYQTFKKSAIQAYFKQYLLYEDGAGPAAKPLKVPVGKFWYGDVPTYAFGFLTIVFFFARFPDIFSSLCGG